MPSIAGATPAEIERVAAYFAQADADGDGVVGLREGAAFFKMSGLPQSSLKTIWSLVVDSTAGSRHQLNREQFCVAFQLIEYALANGSGQCPITKDLLSAPNSAVPTLIPESPTPFEAFDGPFSPGPESLSPARSTHCEEADGPIEQDFFTSATTEQTASPMHLHESTSKLQPKSQPSVELAPPPVLMLQSSAATDTTGDDPFAPSPRTAMAATTPGVDAHDFSSTGSSVGPQHSYSSSSGGHDDTNSDMIVHGFQGTADVSSAPAQFDDDPFAFGGGLSSLPHAEDADPFRDSVSLGNDQFGSDPFGDGPRGSGDPFDDGHTFAGPSRADHEGDPPLVAVTPEPEQFVVAAMSASIAGDTTLNAEATRAALVPDVVVEVQLSRTAEGFGIVIGEDAVLSGWTDTAGKGAERRLKSFGVGLGWRIMTVAGHPVANRADVVTRLGETTGHAQVSFTFCRTPAVDDATGGGAPAPVPVGDGGHSTPATGEHGLQASRSLGRLVAFETLAHCPPSHSVMAAGTEQAATQSKDCGRSVLSFLASAPKTIAALEREITALLKEQEAEQDEFLKLRVKFEAEVTKITEDHEKNYERAVRKDQKKGTGRHSSDKWTTAAATDVRACEAKYANELRMRADRMLRGRRLVAELYLRGMETIQVRAARANQS
jgi:hypothetical protein